MAEYRVRIVSNGAVGVTDTESGLMYLRTRHSVDWLVYGVDCPDGVTKEMHEALTMIAAGVGKLRDALYGQTEGEM